ncbi:MAG: ATP-binding cassette domain-containing protein [Desulfovibrio sp.]|uniref:ATP-binding cassette domain-containing protein n=1 Tax=Desulfovibrio sp. 7SRBS1 TaxID=3378064 RepID=UPI003B4108AD
MPVLSVQNVGKSFGGRDLFAAVSFDVHGGSRLAVVGPNGCGKSTLMRILAQQSAPDTGIVSIKGGGNVGYSAQELDNMDLDQELLSWVLSVFPSWVDFWKRWEKAVEEGNADTLKRLGAEQVRLEQQFGYNLEHKAESVLFGLGFAGDELHKPLKLFSGGWRERAKLARIIVQGTDVLFLDEPTNHLDLEAVEWLEQYLLTFPGVLVFVAHDRVFLDNLATHTLFMNMRKPVMRAGNFTDFLAWREENELARERQAAKISAKIDHQMEYISRFRVKARKAAQAQSKLKAVEKMQRDLEDLSSEKRVRTLSFHLPQPERAEKVVASVANMQFAFPGHDPLWPLMDFQIYRGQKIALVAPNGTGKSTLIKLLAGELKPDTGIAHLGSKTSLGYFCQHQTEILNTANSVIGEMRRLCDPRSLEEELKSILGLFLLGESYFERKVASLSGGEKSRLVMASLFMARANFLLLDEPTNHLDLESREALVTALKAYEGTLFMVAHDRYLLNEVADQIWVLSHDGITVHTEGFSEYEHKMRQEKEEKSQGNGAAGKVRRKLDKEEKRRRAELRNELGRRLRPKKEEYERLETELEQVAEAQAELEQAMADPAICADQEKLMRMTNDYQKAKEREEELFERMTVLETELGELEAEREALLA